MNYELYFIKNFVIKSRQNRLLYELQNPRKRRDGIGRFCHDAEYLLDMRKICDIQDFEKLSGNLKCHIIAYHPELDNSQCSLKQAFTQVLGNGMATIIIGEEFAIVETEQVQGSPNRYFLKIS